jgi:hypothetical protein
VPVGLKWASQLGGIAAFMASSLLFAVLDRRP